MSGSDKFKDADIWKQQKPAVGIAALATMAAQAQIAGDKARMNGPSEEPPEINGIEPVAESAQEPPEASPQEPDMGAVAADIMTSPPTRLYEVGEQEKPKQVRHPAYRLESGALINFRTQATRMIVAGLHKLGFPHATKDNFLSDRAVSKTVEKILLENLTDIVNQPDDGHQATKLKLIRSMTIELMKNRNSPAKKPPTRTVAKRKIPKRRR